MRFRSFGSFPSFTGYLRGFTFTRVAGYAIANGLGNWIRAKQSAHQYAAEYDRQIAYRRALIEVGILPRKSLFKTKPANATLEQSGPIPIYRNSDRPKQAIRDRWPVASPWQPQPAAVSKNGGLRGSLATRKRRR